MISININFKEGTFSLSILRRHANTVSNCAHKTIIAAAVTFGCAGFVEAAPVNITGTWEGQAACDELIAGKYTSDIFTDKLLITQVGDQVLATAFGVIYKGTVQQFRDGPNDGEAVLYACGGTPDHETIRIQHINVRSQGKSELDGITIYESTAFFPGSVAFGTCKLSYTRASRSNPNVPACR
jgi:hypothetical protein